LSHLAPLPPPPQARRRAFVLRRSTIVDVAILLHDPIDCGSLVIGAIEIAGACQESNVEREAIRSTHLFGLPAPPLWACGDNKLFFERDGLVLSWTARPGCPSDRVGLTDAHARRHIA
jgi:hypothetical protein